MTDIDKLPEQIAENANCSIAKLAREIVAKLLRDEGYNLQAKEADDGAWDSGAAVKSARLGILEGERRGMEKAAVIADEKAKQGCGCWCVGEAIRKTKL